MNKYSPSVFTALFRHVNKGSDEECWPWMGAIGNGGYGKMTHDGKYFAPHIVTWSGANERREPIGNLLNTCGLRSCVNPSHWRERKPGDVGTSKDNTGSKQVLFTMDAEMAELFDVRCHHRGWSRAKMLRFAVEHLLSQPIPMIEKTTVCIKCRNGQHCGGGVIFEDVDTRWVCRCAKCAPGAGVAE